MNFQSFKLSILCAAIFTICFGPVAAAQEHTETKQKEANAESSKVQTAQQKQASAKITQENTDGQETLLLDVEMLDICGQKVNLKKYEGKVVLVVNVASKCGFTGQYKPLQSLHKQYNQHGLEVVAFPCNQFGKQEPKDEPAISAFCKKKFGIEFDMYSKVHVKGKKQVELFKRLTQCELQPAGKGEVRWNFEKFLIGKDGKPVARFRSNVAPDSEILVSKLKEALGIKEEKEKPGTKNPEEEKASTPAKQDAEKLKATKVKEDKKS